MLTYSCSDTQAFVITDIVAPDNISEEHIQEAREKFLGTEVHLLFSDNDVRIIVKPRGEKTESMILQKIGGDLYRGGDGHDVIDLELETIFSYIKSGKITMYDKESDSSSIWNGTIILERK